MRRGGGREEVLNPAAKSAGDHRVATPSPQSEWAQMSALTKDISLSL